MLAITSPAPMQGSSFFRNTPTSRLTSSLLASVSRRIAGSAKICCSDRSISTESINPSNSPSPPPPPPPPSLPPFSAPRSTDTAHGEESRGRGSILAPLPSSSFRNDAAHRWGRGDNRESSYLDEWGFRSASGSRSEPSHPSIPGKFSKYSKPVSRLHTGAAEKRAEKRDKKAFRKPMGDVAARPDPNVAPREDESSSTASASTPPIPGANAGTGAGTGAHKAMGKKVPLREDQLPGWMKEYQFTYSEAPSVPIVGFRETPWSPFGPPDMVARPWTGRAPLQPSKKKRPEFDSFNPPPLGKKGVKYVQRPGPFPPGQGPKPGKTREEILGEPLTSVEILELVNGVNKGSKQLNLGRDGLTHNMLDVIHSHWKRSVICKIKCKGVPTVDMDNLARVVEEKTGGVIIHRTGGVIYVFRGRNYNSKDRPKIPIMLWKPPDPIYPRLIQPIPEGLTLEEAKSLRARGRKITPVCKLAKNGVYLSVVADVRAQFQIDDIVKVDCEGMHATDYKKIGAKLKDLVPCTLLSFEKEQIIMCRKRTVVAENGGLDSAADGEKLDDGEGTGDATGRRGSSTGQSVPVMEDQHREELFAKEDDAHSEVVSGVVDGNTEDAVPLLANSSPGSAATASVTTAANLKEDAVANSRNEVSISTSTVTDRGTGSIGDKSPVMDGGGSDFKSAVNVHSELSDSQSDMMSKEMRATRGALDDDDAFKLKMGDAEDVLGSTVPSRNIEVGSSSGYDGLRGDLTSSSKGWTTEGFATVSRLEEDDENEEEEEDVDVDALWEKAIEEGKALELDEQHADSDHVYRAASELFSGDLEQPADSSSSNDEESLEKGKQDPRQDSSRRVPRSSPFQAPPMGRLGVDELAKLLAP